MTTPIVVTSRSAIALIWLLTVATPPAPAGDAPPFSNAQLRRGAVKELATGKLLVAARGLPDPNFSDTVVLIAELNDDGAMGLILNRQVDVPLERFVPGLAEGTNTQSAFFGGPVQPRGALGLMRSGNAVRDTRHIADDIYLVHTREALHGLIRIGTGSSRFRVYLGYSGWGAGQLQEETARGSWHVLDGDAGIVFDRDPDTLWQRLIRRATALSARWRSPAPALPRRGTA